MTTRRARSTARLKAWPGWLLLALVVVGLLAFGTARELGPMSPDERVEVITRRLACPICDGESVYESSRALGTAREDLARAERAGDGADDHESLEPDVHDARALAEEQQIGKFLWDRSNEIHILLGNKFIFQSPLLWPSLL